MELDGLIRCKNTLDEKNVRVSVLTTDRHVAINAWMKKNWPEVKHLFDSWHLGKSMYEYEHMPNWVRKIVFSLQTYCST